MTSGGACRPGPVEELDGVHHLDGVAGRGGERLVHVGDEGAGLQPGAVGDLRPGSSPAPRESSIFCMKAPEPVLTSRTSACRPAASFFDRIEAVISGDRLDGRRDVADGVEALVGRREVGGLADDGAADRLTALRKSALPGWVR